MATPSSSSSSLSKNLFLCSICQDEFIDPFTIPCGHNFCRECISQNGTGEDGYLCPICQMFATTTPQLLLDTAMFDMVSHFKNSSLWEVCTSLDKPPKGPASDKEEEVPCDICTGTKLKASKSCLVCLASYCETHLEPHLTAARLKRHKLIDPVENLEEQVCTKHNKLLELFCKTDHTFVCIQCFCLDHKSHDVVSLEEGHQEKKAVLGKTGEEIGQMIRERELKIEEIERSVELSKGTADKVKTEGVQVVTSLLDDVHRGLEEFIKMMEEQQETTKRQADGFVKELEEEIAALKKRRTEVEHLSHSEDHSKFIKSVQPLNRPPSPINWTQVRITSPTHEATVVTAVAQLEDTLSKKMKMLFEAELKRLQKFAVDVTLDPDTAHPDLILSDDLKQVTHDDERTKKNLQTTDKNNDDDHPDRFSKSIYVLGKQSFSSGRFYYEVQVKRKTKWNLGVVKESINRKEHVPLSRDNGYWAVCLRKGGRYEIDSKVYQSAKGRHQKVGVFVDYEEGLVSFYDVDSAFLIYSFTDCRFSEKILPFFGPCANDGGKNSAPLVISPPAVNQETFL